MDSSSIYTHTRKPSISLLRRYMGRCVETICCACLLPPFAVDRSFRHSNSSDVPGSFRPWRGYQHGEKKSEKVKVTSDSSVISFIFIHANSCFPNSARFPANLHKQSSQLCTYEHQQEKIIAEETFTIALGGKETRMRRQKLWYAMYYTTLWTESIMST